MKKIKLIEDEITKLILYMESNQLTSVELNFSSGWKFKLHHAKATKQLIGLKKGQKVTYPRKKGFKESYLTSK